MLVRSVIPLDGRWRTSARQRLNMKLTAPLPRRRGLAGCDVPTAHVAGRDQLTSRVPAGRPTDKRASTRSHAIAPGIPSSLFALNHDHGLPPLLRHQRRPHCRRQPALVCTGPARYASRFRRPLCALTSYERPRRDSACCACEGGRCRPGDQARRPYRQERHRTSTSFAHALRHQRVYSLYACR